MKEEKQPIGIDYWKKANLQTLHQYSKKWLSTIDFYYDELQFMEHLLQKHFLYFFEKERANDVTSLISRLRITLKEELNQLGKAVQLHEFQLAGFLKSAIKGDEKKYRDEQGKLDYEIGQFEENFKQTKQELFQIAEEVLKEEKMKLLLAKAG